MFMAEFSRVTIAEYLPIIKSIFASFEVQDKGQSDMNKRSTLRVAYLEKDYGTSRLAHAMRLIGIWLQGTDFKSETFYFTKVDPEAKWSDMLRVIEAKILEYSNSLPVIVLILSSSGRITREICGVELTYDFASDKLKLQVLSWLPEDGRYLKVDKLTASIGSKSDASVRKMIGDINKTAKSKLQLPIKHPLIDSKQRSGYRIDPIYNIVRVK